jgi:hypothetical protein
LNLEAELGKFKTRDQERWVATTGGQYTYELRSTKEQERN